MIYWLTSNFFRVISFFIFPMTITGREHIPQKGPVILASNHISNLDPFILSCITTRKISFMAKDSLFKPAWKGFLFRSWHAFPVNRDKADFYAIRESLKHLKNGEPLLLFPEGTRGVGDRPKEVHAGVGLIVQKTGVPVLPILIEGSDQVMLEGSKWFKHGKITIKIGPPLSFSPDGDRIKTARQIVSQIYALAK